MPENYADALVYLADQQAPALRRQLLASWQAAADSVRLGQGVTKDVGRVEATLMGAWADTAVPRMEAALRTAQQAVTASVGKATIAKVAAEEAWRYDAVNPRAVAAARRHVGTFIRESTLQQRDAVRQVIARVAGGEISTDAAARHIRGVMGLTGRMEASAEKFRQRTLAAGVAPAKAEALFEKHRQKLLRERAETIARTETIRALNMGRQEAWQQAREAGLLPPNVMKKWSLTWDDRLCPICRAMAGEVVPLDGVFTGGVEGPPRHPRCRCAITIVAGKRAVAPPPPALPPVVVNPPIVVPPVRPVVPVVKPTPPPKPRVRKVTPPKPNIFDEMRAAAKAPDAPAPAPVGARLSAKEAAARVQKRWEHGFSKTTTESGRVSWKAHTGAESRAAERGRDSRTWTAAEARAKAAGSSQAIVDAATREALDAWKASYRQTLLDEIAAAEPVQIEVNFYGKKYWTNLQRDYIGRVIADVSKLVDRRALGLKSGEKLYMEVRHNPGRAYASMGHINIHGTESASTIAHELGHVFEHASRINGGSVHRDINAYLERRLAKHGKGEQPLSKLTGSKFYRPTEVADPDGFKNPYMGKSYKAGNGERMATEVGSMAMEDIVGGHSMGSDAEVIEAVLHAWRGERFGG